MAFDLIGWAQGAASLGWLPKGTTKQTQQTQTPTQPINIQKAVAATEDWAQGAASGGWLPKDTVQKAAEVVNIPKAASATADWVKGVESLGWLPKIDTSTKQTSTVQSIPQVNINNNIPSQQKDQPERLNEFSINDSSNKQVIPYGTEIGNALKSTPVLSNIYKLGADTSKTTYNDISRAIESAPVLGSIYSAGSAFEASNTYEKTAAQRAAEINKLAPTYESNIKTYNKNLDQYNKDISQYTKNPTDELYNKLSANQQILAEQQRTLDSQKAIISSKTASVEDSLSKYQKAAAKITGNVDQNSLLTKGAGDWLGDVGNQYQKSVEKPVADYTKDWGLVGEFISGKGETPGLVSTPRQLTSMGQAVLVGGETIARNLPSAPGLVVAGLAMQGKGIVSSATESPVGLGGQLVGMAALSKGAKLGWDYAGSPALDYSVKYTKTNIPRFGAKAADIGKSTLSKISDLSTPTSSSMRDLMESGVIPKKETGPTASIQDKQISNYLTKFYNDLVNEGQKTGIDMTDPSYRSQLNAAVKGEQARLRKLSQPELIDTVKKYDSEQPSAFNEILRPTFKPATGSMRDLIESGVIPKKETGPTASIQDKQMSNYLTKFYNDLVKEGQKTGIDMTDPTYRNQLNAAVKGEQARLRKLSQPELIDIVKKYDSEQPSAFNEILRPTFKPATGSMRDLMESGVIPKKETGPTASIQDKQMSNYLTKFYNDIVKEGEKSGIDMTKPSYRSQLNAAIDVERSRLKKLNQFDLNDLIRKYDSERNSAFNEILRPTFKPMKGSTRDLMESGVIPKKETGPTASIQDKQMSNYLTKFYNNLVKDGENIGIDMTNPSYRKQLNAAITGERARLRKLSQSERTDIIRKYDSERNSAFNEILRPTFKPMKGSTRDLMESGVIPKKETGPTASIQDKQMSNYLTKFYTDLVNEGQKFGIDMTDPKYRDQLNAAITGERARLKKLSQFDLKDLLSPYESERPSAFNEILRPTFKPMKGSVRDLMESGVIPKKETGPAITNQDKVITDYLSKEFEKRIADIKSKGVNITNKDITDVKSSIEQDHNILKRLSPIQLKDVLNGRITIEEALDIRLKEARITLSKSEAKTNKKYTGKQLSERTKTRRFGTKTEPKGIESSNKSGVVSVLKEPLKRNQIKQKTVVKTESIVKSVLSEPIKKESKSQPKSNLISIVKQEEKQTPKSTLKTEIKSKKSDASAASPSPVYEQTFTPKYDKRYYDNYGLTYVYNKPTKEIVSKQGLASIQQYAQLPIRESINKVSQVSLIKPKTAEVSDNLTANGIRALISVPSVTSSIASLITSSQSSEQAVERKSVTLQSQPQAYKQVQASLQTPKQISRTIQINKVTPVQKQSSKQKPILKEKTRELLENTLISKSYYPLFPSAEPTKVKKKKKKFVTPSHWEYGTGANPEDVTDFIFGSAPKITKNRKGKTKDLIVDRLSSGMFDTGK